MSLRDLLTASTAYTVESAKSLIVVQTHPVLASSKQVLQKMSFNGSLKAVEA